MRIRVLALLLVAVGAGGLGVASVSARDLLDPNDPALAASVIVPLRPAPGPAGAASVQIVSNGITFQFQSLDGTGIAGAGGITVLPKFQFNFRGVLLTITPPVTAIGFFGEEIDGTTQGLFTGTLGTEEVRGLRVPGPLVPVFAGAADIGEISAVLFPTTGSSAAFVLTEMRFVPSGTPPPTNVADLALGKAVNGLPLVTSGSRSDYAIDVLNQGPDTAVGVEVLDFLPPGTTFVSSNPPATLTTSGVARIPLGDLAA